jgi:pyrroloquinoline quinone biosynthesis protein B
MIVRVLGSAAGGGVPQWNCACAHCNAARTGRAPRRTSSGFAVSGNGERWWLVNVSPDIAQQIEAFAPLQPRSGRGTPIAGMLLTDANVDHVGGFAVLRQTGDHAFAVYSSDAIREIALTQPAYAPFAREPHAWHTIPLGESVALDARLEARAVPVEGLTPGYAGRRAIPGAVIAFHVRDRETGGSVLFAPVFVDVTPTLIAAAEDSDAAFFDGSFWSDEELGDVGVEKAARSLGHLPVGGEDGSLAVFGRLARRPQRFFAHLNTTNPLLDPTSAAARAMTEAGFALAEDGLELRL